MRAFAKVAEELHFGRAARALYLTTPALSQQIARLEKAVNATLFDRSSRRVELTLAGEQLLPLAREVVSAFDRVENWKRRRGAPSLRLGFASVGPMKLAAEIFAEARAELPQVRLDVAYVHQDEVPKELLSGQLDLAFLWGPLIFDGVRTRTLTTQPRWLLLSETHPLAGRDELTVPDLDRIPLLRPHSADPTYIAWSVVDPRPGGRRATTGPSVRNLEEALTMVAAGLGGYLVPRDVAAAVQHPLVLAQPVSDLSDSPFSVSVAADGVAETTNALLDVVLDVAARFDAMS
ncbi:LysR substrate-binding domain-containing protein [Nonomuraea jabiensis]|uniref:LysR family transcriptional regulator n=1 Tax=Nonomuraea jabiensis TaxID=882448 RepID=UPI00343DF35C